MLYRLDSALHLATPALLLAALAAWLAMAVVLVRKRSGTRWGSRLLWAGGLVFGVIALGVILMSELMVGAARDDVAQALSAPATWVRVDGVPSAEPRAIVVALRHLHDRAVDHSHPLARHRVDVDLDRRRVTLWLARDSKDPSDWWVFDPRTHAGKLNAVGHVRLAELD